MTPRTWFATGDSTTAGKLWLGFGTSILLLVLLSSAIIGRVLSFQTRSDEIAQSRRADAVVQHLLSSTRGYALAVREYGLDADPRIRRLALSEAADVARQLQEYQRLPAGLRHRTPLPTRFASAWRELRELGDATLGGNGPPTPPASRRLQTLRGDIEDLLHEAAPPEAANANSARRTAALADLGGVVDFALILLVAGVAVALLTSGLVGRGIVRSERKLWDSRERMRVTLASIGDAVIATDIQGRVSYLNAVAESLTGWASAQATGQPLESVFRLVDPSTGVAVASHAARALREGMTTGLSNHTTLLSRDGTRTPIDESVAPIRDEQSTITGAVLIFRDASGRRRIEETLRQARDEMESRVEIRTGELARSNQFLHALLDHLQEGIVACDADGVLTLFNRATREFHGMPQAPLAAERWTEHYDLYLPDGVTPMPTDAVPLLRALRGEPVNGVEMVIAPKDGPPRFLLAHGQAFHDEQGHLRGAVVSMHDVTRRKQAEAALQRAHDDLETRVAERTAQLTQVNDQLLTEIAQRQQADEQLRRSEARKTAMFEAALDCIITTNHEDTIIEFNAAAEQTFGYRRQDVLGRNLPDVIIPAAYRERHRAGLAHYLATGEGPVMDKRLELSALRADGSEFPIELTVTRIPVPGPPVFTAYLRDITERKRAEAALAESETQWRGIFERLHEGFVLGEMVYDVDGKAVDWRYLEINAGWEQITGLSRDAALGLTLTEVVPGAEPEWVSEFADVVQTGNPANFLRHVAALDRWYEVHAFRAAPGRFAALFMEVTQRQQAQLQLRESEQRLQFVMDSMPQKVFTAHPDGGIFYYNPQWMAYSGLTFEQIQDWGWKQFVHPDDLAENVRLWQQSIDTGEAFEFEQRFRHVEGAYRWHISRAVALRDEAGRIRMWIGTNTDIHEQKLAAEELRQLAAALSEADRRKTEFLAVLAHELRNPLAPMSNAVQILQLAKGNAEAITSVTGVMQRQVNQMVRLVDDLLDVNRISRGKIGLRLERVELASIVQQAFEASRPACDQAGHDLAVMLPDEPVFLHADPLRLVQVFSNLLNNACKFTGDGGRIGLSLERRGSDAVVTVTDNGVGIPADKLATIFEMFTQVDQSLERPFGGLGIGLTLVQQLVELHGGTVNASSAGPSQGSEFVVRLPVVDEPAPPG